VCWVKVRMAGVSIARDSGRPPLGHPSRDRAQPPWRHGDAWHPVPCRHPQGSPGPAPCRCFRVRGLRHGGRVGGFPSGPPRVPGGGVPRLCLGGPSHRWPCSRLLYSVGLGRWLLGWHRAGRVAGRWAQHWAVGALGALLWPDLGHLPGPRRCRWGHRLCGWTVATRCARRLGSRTGRLMPSLPRRQPQETAQEGQGCSRNETASPHRAPPPALTVGDDAVDECRCERLLVRRTARLQGRGAERIHHPRDAPGLADNTP